MKQVASLQYGIIFKKAFSQVEIFKAFVKDIIGVELEIEKVETEKSFGQHIGNVKVEFDLYAEDFKNRVIVEIQHQHGNDYYDRFLHYHCVALIEQAANYRNYKPDLTVYTIVVLTSADKHQTDVAIIDFDPKDRCGKPLNEIKHKVIYLSVKYVDDNTPEVYREWLFVIKESLTEQIEETKYTRPELHRVIDTIAKNLISPEEKYQMIEEYNFEIDKRKKFEEGLKKGREEGEQMKALAIAKNLLVTGINVDKIAQITGLSIKEIKQNFEP